MITKTYGSPYLEALARLAARLDARMEGEEGAAAGAVAEVPVTADTPNPVKEAGKAFLAGLTKEQLESEVGTIEDGDIATIPAEGSRGKKRPPAGKKDPAPAPAAAKPAAQTTPTRGKDGKFAPAGDPGTKIEDLTDEELDALSDEELAEIIADKASASADTPAGDEGADPEAGKGKKAKKDDDSAAVVVLKGLAERGEEDIELEIDDPAVIERIRRLENDGLRRSEYNERLQAVEDRDAELASIEANFEANPVGVMLQLIKPENQLEVARALLAEHFEALAPTIEEFFDKPESVPNAKLAARDKAQENDGKAAQKITARNQARAIERAVVELIPEDIDRQTAARFMRDAERDLLDAVGAGERVSPTTAAILLKDRLKMYGFGPNTVKEPKDPAGARPLSERAKALAARRSKASERQDRIKRVQAARRNASAVAPPGAGSGGATVREPLVPKGATIGEASAAIRAKNITSWAEIQRG